MAQAPIMPLFTDALIGDTTHLSAEQFGCYLLILIATWRNNGKALPDDDARMAKICKIGTTKWRRKVRSILHEMFEVNESGWHQQRLEKEWNRVSEWYSQQRSAGRAGGLAKAKRTSSRKLATHKPYIEESSSSLPSTARACVPVRMAAHARGGEPSPPPVAEADTWKPLGLVLGHPAPPPPEPSEDNRRAARQQQHMAHLKAHGPAGELDLYLEAAMSDDPAAAQRMFDLAEAQMQAWQHQHGEIAA